MNQSINKQDFVITRTFGFPVELVWKAWTDPKLVMLWWGPKDYTSPRCEIDFREGGKYLFCMRAPEEQGGHELYSIGFFKKIIPMKRLEFTQYLSDKDGNIVNPAKFGVPYYPEEIQFVIEFKDLGDQTELTITEYGWMPGKMSEYAVIGMNQSLDKLAANIGSLHRES